MGFHPMNDVHHCLENGEAFSLDFLDFCSKQWGLFVYWLTVIAENEV